MAKAGRLKSSIDLLKKKMAAQGDALAPERRRRLHKRLKRLQRARRLATVAEAKASKPAKQAAEAAPAQT